MKRNFHAVCLVLLMATSLVQPALAQPRPAGLWTLDSTASHEALSSPVGMAYDAGGNLYVARSRTGGPTRFSPRIRTDA